jgi:maltose alpha-D-glucosyltransferase/alpha-amylase
MARRRPPERPEDEQELWYKDAVVYEAHVKAYADSDDDGIGDLRGLIGKLDYLQDLGVTALWLLPFYPSPLKDDGYDIASYREIHPSYGSLRDFRVLLREAHERGLYVITELVLNHTSDQHPWFQRARRSPAGSAERNFYVWSDTPEKYQEARIIFQDFEHSNWTWDREAGAYYWHRFYSHQPDLNWDNPEVKRAMFSVVDFWLEMGVDGLRLDAIPYLIERDGTNGENLPETLDILRELRRHMDDKFRNRMLLAEANQWPEDAVAYFGKGDMCNMAFHFPVMPRMFMATRMEDRFPIIDILEQTPAIPEGAQWAMFLRNHDELTLEMVTDEERDYMYRVYANDPQARINLGIRRRLAPLLGNDRNVIEMMNVLLMSLPGTPVVYYGDEIGMGDNIYLGDRDGVRTPMQWSGDRNAGFSRGNPQRLFLPVVIDPEYHYEALNVETQNANPNSLLWWMKRLIAVRKRYKAFGRGSIEFLYPDNRKVLAFLRQYEDERILVVVNLSRHSQFVELDLSRFRNSTPVELFGHTEFPRIGDLSYLLTLGPHQFYWFSLEQQRAEASNEQRLPRLDLGEETWERVLTSRRHRAELAESLPAYLRGRRWFGGKARRITSAEVTDAIPLPAATKPSDSEPIAFLTLLRVEYTEGDPETYALPLTAVGLARGKELLDYHPGAVVAMLRTGEGDRVLVDAVWEASFGKALLATIARRKRSKGSTGTLASTAEPSFADARLGRGRVPSPTVLSAEQSNTSLLFGDRGVLKLFRRPEEGVNPDLEIGRFLTREAHFEHVPPVCGAVEFRRGRTTDPATIAVLQKFVPNEGDAWAFTLDAVGGFFERAASHRDDGLPEEVERLLPGRPTLLEMTGAEPPELAKETIGPYLRSASLLGRRTAELHLALASAPPENRAFAPEPFTTLYQRSLYQSMRTLAVRTFRQLRRVPGLDDPLVMRVLDLEGDVVRRFEELLRTKIDGVRTRIHGDCHLGQVLWTGKDFVLIDFEGEPVVPLGERRIKRSPFRDVAGMLRSFHYAAHTALAQDAPAMSPTGEPGPLEPWAEFWYRWVSAVFLRTYLFTAGEAPFVPPEHRQLEVVLETELLNKAVYELRYEANMRPDWIRIPARGILDLLQAAD